MDTQPSAPSSNRHRDTAMPDIAHLASWTHEERLAAGQACFDAALSYYLPRGFAVLCCCDPEHIGVGKKHGQHCDSPGKAPMHLWKAFQTTMPTAQDVHHWWHDYPIGNVGCALGPVSGLVRVDVDGAAGESVLVDWSHGDIPPTWTFQSSPGSRGLLYAWPRDRPCRSTTQALPGDHKELRLMGSGSQTILPPSRHPSGSLYHWLPGSGPEECPLALAPPWLQERLRPLPPPERSPSQSRYPSPTQAHVEEALAALPSSNPSVHYDEWLQIGMALHSTGEPWARDVWETWSQESPKYDGVKQEKSWLSFHPNGRVSLGTLYHLAQQAGWQSQPRRAVPLMTSPNGDRDHLPYGDVYNARAFVARHGQAIRFCGPWDAWFTWEGTHWAKDDTGETMRRAKDTMIALLHEARARLNHVTGALLDLAMEPETDDTRAKGLKAEQKAAQTLFAHVAKSLNNGPLTAMLKQAESEAGIAILPEVFDTNIWALNVLNGTLDLRTGTLHPHAQTDMLTKCLRLEYDPTAPCPIWERFLWHIMGGTDGDDNPDMGVGELERRQSADTRARTLIGFLQRAIGYSLTGDTSEQCLFILYGPTKTGKTTSLETIGLLLGPYAQQAEITTFLHKEKESVRNDLATLAGSRFISAVEVQEGKRLAESLVKQLTGSDRVTARFLFQEYFTFKPQFKVFLGTNHKPVIHDTDDAIWERIRLIPFTVHIPRDARDKALNKKLEAELPGILAWAVRGCLLWQKHGLHEPEAVEEATKGYREEMDHIGQFIADSCLVGPNYQVKAQALYEAYQRWCTENVQEPITMTMFGKRLNERYGPTVRQSHTSWRVGIGLAEKVI